MKRKQVNAQLAFFSDSPCPDGSIFPQSQRVTVGDRYIRNIRKLIYLNRLPAILIRSIPQCAIIIFSPCPDRTILFQYNGIMISSLRFYHILKITYHNGILHRIISAVSKLSVCVFSPCPDCPVTAYRKAVSCARRHRDIAFLLCITRKQYHTNTYHNPYRCLFH